MAIEEVTSHYFSNRSRSDSGLKSACFILHAHVADGVLRVQLRCHISKRRLDLTHLRVAKSRAHDYKPNDRTVPFVVIAVM